MSKNQILLLFLIFSVIFSERSENGDGDGDRDGDGNGTGGREEDGDSESESDGSTSGAGSSTSTATKGSFKIGSIASVFFEFPDETSVDFTISLTTRCWFGLGFGRGVNSNLLNFTRCVELTCWSLKYKMKKS